MLYKSAIINIVSIFEAFVLECAERICSPSKCKSISHCKYHFNKTQRNNCKEAIAKLCNIGVLSLSSEEINRIGEIIDLRNHVHIRLADSNEYSNEKFSLELYNEVILTLKKLSDMVYSNGVPLYGICKGKN